MFTMELKLAANEVVVGDALRFRMSKQEPFRWLRVLAVHDRKKTVSFMLEHGCWTSHSKANKSDFATVRRAK